MVAGNIIEQLRGAVPGACAAKRPAVALFAAQGEPLQAPDAPGDARGAKRSAQAAQAADEAQRVRGLAGPGLGDPSTTKDCPIDDRSNGSWHFSANDRRRRLLMRDVAHASSILSRRAGTVAIAYPAEHDARTSISFATHPLVSCDARR